MSVDPLDRLRRPAGSPLHPAQPPRTEPERGHPTVDRSVAPEWVGPCLRVAGDAATPALTLRSRDGRLTALPYSYLTAVRLDPSGSLELDFVGYAVSIGGKRLKLAFEALAGQSAMELAESAGEFDDGGEAPLIESIAIVATQER